MHTYIVNSSLSNSNSLPIRFITVGRDHNQENIKNQGFASFHILLIQDGKGVVRCNGQEHELSRGTAFLNCPNVPIEYINNGGLVTAFITATGDALSLMCKYFNTHEFIYRSDINTEKYLKAIDGIIKEFREHRRQSVLSKLAYSLYMDFFDEMSHKEFGIVDKVSRYIENNFNKKITLEQLALMHSISVSKLCHDFKAQKKCSVFEYILNIRLSNAQNLITSLPNLMIKEIASHCGFEDVSYFCKAFKEKYGLTPSEYKKLNIG